MAENPPPLGNVIAVLFTAAVILLACFMTFSRACSSLDDPSAVDAGP